MMKTKNNVMVNTKKLVITAMFTALTTVATIVIQIPLLYGYVNLGDMFVLLCAFILGPIYGMAAAGIGSALGDIIGGYVIYAPGTFVIKALMVLTASFISKILKLKVKYEIISQVVAGVVAELVMVAGYFFYEAVILGYSWGAVASITSNLLQGAVGITLAVTLMNVFNSRKLFSQTQKNKDTEKLD